MQYRFLEDIATADVAFEAYGKTPEELFQNCALALTKVMAEISTVKPILHVTCHMSHVNLEDLLFDFLSELVYRKDSKQLLFSKFQVKIKKLEIGRPASPAGGYSLTADLWGETINPQKHKLGSDVKAVTWHMFKVEQGPKGWLARAVLDI